MQVFNGDELDPAPPIRRNPTRLTVARALIALAVAFIGAQLVGKLAGDVARSLAGVRGDSLAPAVIIPSMLASELTLLGVALLTPLTASLPLFQALGLSPAKWRVYVAATLGTVMLGPLGDRLMSLFAALFPGLTLGVVPALHELAQQLPFAWLWPTFAVLPGIAEELLFRGVLQRSIARPALAIPLSGAAFALFHVDPVHVVGVLPLGLFLAWTAQRSGTLVTVVAHVMNNSIALVAIKSNALDVGYGAESDVPLPWLLGSLLLVAAAVFVLARETRPLEPLGRTA